MKRKIKKSSQVFYAWEGATGISVEKLADSVCNPTNHSTKSVPWLEEDLQTVDAGDADIADGADFVGAEKIDGASTLIEIEL